MLDFKTSFYKKLFRSLENNAVIMRVEEDGRYYPIWCSREFTEMIEGTEEEFIRMESGGTMLTIHPDDQPEIAYLFRNHVTRDGSNSVTVRKYTLKGNLLWVRIHYAFMKEDGQQYAYCTYFNVTDLKESERQTQAMYEGLNRELHTLANESLCVLRLNLTEDVAEEIRGKDLFDSDRAGASVREMVRVRLEHMPLDTDRQNFRNLFTMDHLREQYYKGEGPISVVVFSQRQSGRQCFVRCSVSMRKDPVTSDWIALGVESEYDAQMVMEVLNGKILAQQYDMVCYLSGDSYGIAIGDVANIGKGSVFPKERNGSYTRYLQEQVLPVASEHVHDREELFRSLSLDTIAKKLSEREPYTVDVTCDIEGEIYNKRFMFFVVDPKTKFYILLKSDITELLREQREQNNLMAQALEEARQANIAKTAFLSSMSHEIRTPMNAIIGLDSIALKDPALSEHTREQLEKIGRSAHHLLGLINDILDMSRIESGRMVLKNEEFSFYAMLEQINTMIQSQCQNSGLRYDCAIHGIMDEFYIGDDMKLKQVLINILGNAVKFTPAPGTVSLSVERTACFEDHSTFRFIVKDTGIGMDKSFLPRIFDAFSQENQSRTTKYGSTGLGMAITKNIVEMMNGNISVRSEKGVGSEFTVNVTLKNCDRAGQDTDNFRPQDIHVLIIDDDPIACEHAKLVLEEVGVTADTCMSGAEGLKMMEVRRARREAYNLVLVDMKMPGEDGIEVTRKIRELYSGEATIIILTAYNWDDIMAEAIEAGVDSFLSKPLFASGVLSELRQALRNQTRQPPPAVQRADLNNRRILLAEDMPINAEIMLELLDMRGMTADHAENGQAAVQLFSEHPPHYYNAVLMDVRMPVMDGLDAARAIRSLDRPDAKTIPIIAMTANAFDEDVQRSLQAGMNAHLSKPVDPERLFDTLETLIQDET
ncbi:MAG: response regulator [Oscillibacter sp.]|nr:response regulator [Oscillibacter sp.]